MCATYAPSSQRRDGARFARWSREASNPSEVSVQRVFGSALVRLRRRPAFAIGAVLSLGIGMSLAIAVFRVVDAIVMRPAALGTSTQLVQLVEIRGGTEGDRVPPRFLVAAMAQATTLRPIAAYQAARAVVGDGGDARRLMIARVTPDFFQTFRAAPAMGNTFGNERSASVPNVAVISHRLFATQFGSDPATLGRTIRVGGVPYTVIGVMPEGNDYPNHAQLWLPLDRNALARDARTDAQPYYAVGRLSTAATPQQAAAELAVIHRRVYGVDPDHRLMTVGAVPLQEYLTQQVRQQLRLWVAVALVVLMLCAVNFATMSLARGMRARGELGVRAALGASRRQLASVILSESLLVSVGGGLLAAVLGGWLLGLATASFADPGLRIPTTIGWGTAAVGVIGTAIVGCAFALAPALELSKVDLRTVLQGGLSATPRAAELRGRRALVALQVSLALTATAVVMALIAADRRYGPSDVGFDYSQLAAGEIVVLDTTAGPIQAAQIADRLHQVPSVREVGIYSGCSDASVSAFGRGEADVDVIACRVSPEFLATMGARVVAGALPTSENGGQVVDGVVISRTTAVRAFGSVDAAVGRRLSIERSGWSLSSWLVTGVVDDVGGGLLGFAPSVYREAPLAIHGGAGLLVRVSGDPALSVADLRRELAGYDSRLVISDLNTANDIIARTRRVQRGREVFLGTVAVLAIVLAGAGVFGLTAYTTELRAREFGIRLALGESRAGLLRLVLVDLWWMALIGLAIGGLAAVRLTAFLDSLFRNPMMKAPLVILPVDVVIASGGAVACILVVGTVVPLRRAWSMDLARVLQDG